MQVFALPANSVAYPEHDHAHDGQEEVDIVLRGSAALEIDGERVQMDPECMVRVGPAARRRVLPGPDGVRVLAIGGVPGKLYVRPGDFELGAADVTAAGQPEAR